MVPSAHEVYNMTPKRHDKTTKYIYKHNLFEILQYTSLIRLSVRMYEGHLICNVNNLITQSTDSVPAFAIQRIKEKWSSFQSMYNTLV